MKLNDVSLNPHVDMPSWLRALQQAVLDAEFTPPGCTLGPVSALDELISLEGFAGSESAADRASLRRDLGAALEALGPELEQATRPALPDFRGTTLARIPEFLGSPESARIAAASARVLREVLTSKAAIRAAWRDLVGAFAGESPYEVCLQRLAILREIVEAHGHAWETEVERIARIVNDSAEHAVAAGATVEPPANGNRYEITERAGMSEDNRLALIEAHLSRRPAGNEEIVVWLLISDAVVSEKTIQLGPVGFFDSRMVRSRLRTGPIDPRPFGLPEEIEPVIAAYLLEDVDPEEQVVLARVEVASPMANSIAWARNAVSGLLDIATLGEPRLGWKLESGHLLISGSGWSHLRFRGRGIDFDRWIYQPDRSLARVDPGLIRAWETGDLAAVEAIELARWEQALASSPNQAFRVALGVRNLERVLPSARVPSQGQAAAHWSAVVSYYLKEVWCWKELRRELDDVRFRAVTPPHEFLGEKAIRETEGFYAKLRSISGEGELGRAALVERAGPIGQLFRPGSARRRILDSLAARTAQPSATTAWLSSLGKEFDVLLDRSARQRNAVVHGSPTVPALIGATLPFVADLGTQVAMAARAAAAAGDPLLIWLERERLRALGDRAVLDAGEAPARVV